MRTKMSVNATDGFGLALPLGVELALASADGETGGRYLLASPGNLLVLNLEHWARLRGGPKDV